MNKTQELSVIEAKIADALPALQGYEKGFRDATEALVLALAPAVDASALDYAVTTVLDAYGNNVDDSDLVTLNLNVFDDDGNVVDGTTANLSLAQLSQIVDLASQLILVRSEEQLLEKVLNELAEALSVADVIDTDEPVASRLPSGQRWAKFIKQEARELEEAPRSKTTFNDDQAGLADKAFAEYDFGDGVTVTDTSSWEYTTPGHERTRKVYVETEREDDGPAPSSVLSFTVRFDPETGSLSEAYALDEKGQIWGHLPTAFSLVAITADWLPEDLEVPAYSNGQRWNGWAMPYFTKEGACNLLKFMPDLRYDSAQDAFISKTYDEQSEVDVYPATTIVIDGIPTKTYAIGAGSWCWFASDVTQKNTAHDGPVNWTGSSRWTFDRGAIPGEPFAFLDGDIDSAVAAMVEIQTPGKPACFEVRRIDGILLSRSEFPDLAARIAEHRIAIHGAKSAS